MQVSPDLTLFASHPLVLRFKVQGFRLGRTSPAMNGDFEVEDVIAKGTLMLAV
jgi:hypothetical protein